MIFKLDILIPGFNSLSIIAQLSYSRGFKGVKSSQKWLDDENIKIDQEFLIHK